jgi:hypothetical protein
MASLTEGLASTESAALMAQPKRNGQKSIGCAWISQIANHVMGLVADDVLCHQDSCTAQPHNGAPGSQGPI